MRVRNVVAWLLGQDAVPRPPEVQPHLAAVAGTWSLAGALSPGVYNPAQTTAMFVAPPVGYNTPEIVHVYGTLPPGLIVNGVPDILDVNAPAGGC